MSLTILDPFETKKADYHIHWSGFTKEMKIWGNVTKKEDTPRRESFDTRIAYFAYKCVSLTLLDPFETKNADYYIH